MLIDLILILFCSSFTVVKSELSSDKFDALADLSAMTVKYFSESPDEPFEQPDPEDLSAFISNVSDLWDENGSALYLLTRMAKLVDEKGNNSNGNLSTTAKVIRTMAARSEASQFKSPNSTKSHPNSNSIEQSNNAEAKIESLYLEGRTEEADQEVKSLINETWTDAKRVLESIESAAREQQFNLIAALVKFGEEHEQFRFVSPEDKAQMLLVLRSLEKVNLDPKTAKWLLTMDTFREDQMKLVKILENDLRLKSYKAEMSITTNTVAQILEGIRSIEAGALYSADPDRLLKRFDAYENQDELYEVKALENHMQDSKMASETPGRDNNDSSVFTELDPDDPNYFKKEDQQEQEIDKKVYEADPGVSLDDDGIYDAEERRRDRVAIITVLTIIGIIIFIALGSYLFLVQRRARRNRTMIVVTEALETVT